MIIKRLFLYKLPLFIAVVLLTNNLSGQTKMPNKKEILKAMNLSNKYFMKKWPDPGKEIVNDKVRPSNIWTRGVYYEGLMKLYEIDKKKAYYDYAVEWGNKHRWGLKDGIQTRHADNHCAGQTYIDLYLIDPKPERIRDIKASIDRMVQSEKSDDWDWIDALQMAMPVFAKLGVVYKDTSYFEKMHDLYMYSKLKHGRNGLYNPEDKLWWRDKDFVPHYKEPNGEDCYWARGNGWVYAAMVKTLEILPTNAAHREEYLTMFKNMSEALASIQREDGFWNVSLHDPTNYGGKETTGTSLFVYGMAWGVNNGILPADKYQQILVKGWNAMIKDALHENGFLGWVQGTGKEPKDGQPLGYDKEPNFEDYGLGCFLLAGSEVYKLAK